MTNPQTLFWKKYIATAQLDLSHAAYTKVPSTWYEQGNLPDFNRLYYILEGEGCITINHKAYCPKPGELYLLPAGVIHSYSTLSTNTFGKYWCHFTAKIGELSLFQILEPAVCVLIKEPEAYKTTFDKLIYYAKQNELTSDLHVKSILLELIASFIEQSDSCKINLSAAPSFEKINTVLKYIDDHLTTSISLTALAEIAHFHPNYFIQVFKQFTGQSPIQYINRKRLEKAKHLLTVSELSVSEIADTLGMELSYFSRLFKDQNGFTPTGYREIIPKA